MPVPEPLATAILAKHDQGYAYAAIHEELDQRELFVQMGGVANRDRANAIILRLLDRTRHPRSTRAFTGPALTAAQMPGRGFRIGDKLGADLVVGMAVTTNNEDQVDITPELLDPLWVAEDSIDRALRRAAAGSQSDESHPVTQNNQQGSGISPTPPQFSQSTLKIQESPMWRPEAPYWCTWIEAAQTKPNTVGTTRVDLVAEVPPPPGVLPGTRFFSTFSVASLYLAPGDHRTVVAVNRGWMRGQGLAFVCSAFGNGANLTVSSRGAVI